MTATILLTGKNGQIGRELCSLLPQLGELVAMDRQHMDLAKPDEVRKVVRSVRPQLIVNAAAYTSVDKAESDEAAALAVNAVAPGVIAEEAKKIGAALVHFSTDYVFDGEKKTPYAEEDSPNPRNVYGRTKLAGEVAIQQSGAPHLIFRTAWVYAQEGRNFLLTLLKLATQREELRIVKDQVGAPTWSREVAVATTRVLEQFMGSERGARDFAAHSGIYNMSAAGETSWFHFAEAILAEARGSLPHASWFEAVTGGYPLVTRRVVPISTAEYPTAARRPAYSVLSNERLAKTFNTRLPDWQAQLHAVFAATDDSAHK